MRWIETNGGPLICLPKMAASYWGGIDFISVVRIGNSLSDYDRACSVDSYLDRIAVNDSEGFVLGDEPMITTVVPKHGLGLQVARIIYCNSLVEIEDMLRSGLDVSKSKEIGALRLTVNEPHWVVFDSAYPGSMAEDVGMAFTMPIGTLCIRTFDHQPDEHTSLIIHDIEAV